MHRRQESVLEQWLTEQSAGGERSSGTFTIASERAWEKLGSCQLPSETAWILKLVQAACRSGASSLSIVQTRSKSSVTIHGVSNWSQDVVEAAVLGNSASHPAVGHLAIALRALLVSQRPLSLTYPEGVSVIWNGQAFCPAHKGSGVAGSWTLEVSHSHSGRWAFPLTGTHREATRYAAGIARELIRDCCLASVPIRLDGRLINGLGHLDEVRGSGQRTLLNVVPLEAKEPAHPLWPPEVGQDSSYPFLNPEAFEPLSFEGESAAVALVLNHEAPSEDHLVPALDLESFREDESRFLWMHDGIVVQREPLRVSGVLSLVVIASVGELPTDLSGLSLARSRLKSAWWTSTLAVAEARLRGVLEKTPFLPEEVAVRSPYQRPGPGCLLLCWSVVLSAGVSLSSPLWTESVFFWSHLAALAPWLRLGFMFFTSLLGLAPLFLCLVVLVLAIYHRINPTASVFQGRPRRDRYLAEKLTRELRRSVEYLNSLVE